MSGDAEKKRRIIVLKEVGVGESLEITNPAKLLRLLAERKPAGDAEKQELIAKAEQLEERGVD